MVQIKFVKYNSTRRERFQIKTTILEENGTRYVEKAALSMEGAPHIDVYKRQPWGRGWLPVVDDIDDSHVCGRRAGELP